MDLTQAEAVLGVIDATDRSQLNVALSQLAGGLARPLTQLRGELLSLLADLEAGLDFPEEELPLLDPAKLAARLAAASTMIGRVLSQMETRAASNEAPRVILLGAPNAGKSSLFNALSGRAAALVWHEPGTTRDYLVSDLELEGLRCRLIDTAGVEPEAIAVSGIDAAAQGITAAQSQSGQLRLLCVDATRSLNAWEQEQLATPDSRRIVVWTKSDLAAAAVPPEGALATSSTTGQGLDRLRHRIRAALAADVSGELGVVAGTAVRCRESLRLAAESLDRAHTLLASRAGEELLAVELRTALAELGQVVGEVYTEEVLDVIFSRFCVGK
jgi:tRNA modification GTPase